MAFDEKQIEKLIAPLRGREVKPRFKESVWRQVQSGLAPDDDGNRAIKMLYAALVVSVGIAIVIGVLAIMSFGSSKGEKVLQGRPTTLSAGAQILSGRGGQILAKEESKVQITAGKGVYKMAVTDGHLRFTVPKLEAGFVFEVETDIAVVTVKGTVFEVTMSRDGFSVEVFEGVVACAHAGGARDVKAGEKLAVPRDPAASTRKGTPPAGGGAAPSAIPQGVVIEPVIGEKRPDPKPAQSGAEKRPAPAPAEAAARPADEDTAKADTLLREKKYGEAVAMLTRAYDAQKVQGHREEILFKRGQVELFNLRDYDAAAATFNEYLERFRGGKFYDEATYHVAEARFQKGDTNGAVEWFERYAAATADDSRKASALYNIAALKMKGGAPCGDTAPYLSNALALKPPPDIERKALRSIVSCFVSTGKGSDAAKYLERLEALSPDDDVLKGAKELLKGGGAK